MSARYADKARLAGAPLPDDVLDAPTRSDAEFDRLLDQFLAIFLGLSQQIARNVLIMEGGAERLVVPHHRLHADEVDDALELVSLAVGDDDGDRWLRFHPLRA